MNYPYYEEFLDTMLCKQTQKNINASILQQNLVISLSSSEVIALSQLTYLACRHYYAILTYYWETPINSMLITGEQQIWHMF
jgi:hypothetical protein